MGEEREYPESIESIERISRERGLPSQPTASGESFSRPATSARTRARSASVVVPRRPPAFHICRSCSSDQPPGGAPILAREKLRALPSRPKHTMRPKATRHVCPTNNLPHLNVLHPGGPNRLHRGRVWGPKQHTDGIAFPARSILVGPIQVFRPIFNLRCHTHGQKLFGNGLPVAAVTNQSERNQYILARGKL